MRINNNLMAMNTHRQLGINAGNGAKSIEKLSSGMRINRAGDDAAGLAISEKMRSQIRGLNQASRNGQDGISLIQTAEGALNETHDILQRMRELAVQSANDTNVDTDREAIQNEIDQLKEEVDRIGSTTEFNTQSLLNGNVADDAIQKSIATAAYTGSTFTGVSVDLNSEITDGFYTIEAVADAVTLNEFSDAVHNIGVSDVAVQANSSLTEGQYFVSISATATATEIADVNTAGTDVDMSDLANAENVVEGQYSFKYSGTAEITLTHTSQDGATVTNFTIAFTTSGGFTTTVDLSAIAGFTNMESFEITTDGSITAAATNTGVTVVDVDVDYTAYVMDDTNTKVAGVTGGTTVNEGDTNVQIESTGVYVDVGAALLNGEAAFSVKSTGLAAAVLQEKDDNTFVNAEATFSAVTVYMEANDPSVSFADYGLTFEVGAITAGDKIDIDVDQSAATDRSLTFQIGANSGQEMNLSIDDMRATALGIDAVDVSSASNAKTSIDTLDDALKSVSDQRAKLGAVQNRLEHTIKNVDTTAENLQAAESRVRDVDMAKEMMEFTKNNILQQAAQSMLAQANQAPQGVLQLLR